MGNSRVAEGKGQRLARDDDPFTSSNDSFGGVGQAGELERDVIADGDLG